jgi:glyoxylase-like metal-dependent hydrolase (beta-lactamase superfamily II)
MNADADTPKILQPVPGVWVRQEIDNIAWIDLGEDLLVIDALERPELEEEVLRSIQETTGGKPVRTVVNTHTHYDHVALNPAFVETFVNARTRVLPTTGLAVGSESRPATVIPMPDCHTPEDCIIFLPKDSVLFVGDIFGWGLVPWDRPLTQAKADHIRKTYQQLIAREANVVVPGHGPLCTTDHLRRWLRYFDELIETIHAARSDGASRREIRDDTVPPPEDMADWWRFLQWKHEDSVKKVSQAVVKGSL